MELTKLEQQILNDEIQISLDQDQSDLESCWNQPGIAESCPPGVMPDTWMNYLTDLREATLSADKEEEIEIVQECRPEAGSWKNWQERQNDRDWHLMNMIQAEDERMTPLEVQEEETGQTPAALSAYRESLKKLKDHQYMRNLLDEPTDLERNRQMWRLESLLADYGHEDDWETALQELERTEFQEQGVTPPDPDED